MDWAQAVHGNYKTVSLIWEGEGKGELEKRRPDRLRLGSLKLHYEAWHVKCGLVLVLEFGNSIESPEGSLYVSSATPKYISGASCPLPKYLGLPNGSSDDQSAIILYFPFQFRSGVD